MTKFKANLLIAALLIGLVVPNMSFAAGSCPGGWGVKKNKTGSNCPTSAQKKAGKKLAIQLGCTLCHGTALNAPGIPAPEELPAGENGAVAGSWQKAVQVIMASYDPDGSKAKKGKYPTPAEFMAVYNSYATYMTAEPPTTAQVKKLLKYIEGFKH